MSDVIYLDYAILTAKLRPLREDLTVALTNGCFDLLHVGHVRLLQDAAALGDLLVVALNSDTSVRGNKGAGRPFVPLVERMEMIAALKGVDYVTCFDEPSADKLLKNLQPDVYCKGTDWTVGTVPERNTIKAYGGRIAICGDEKTHSSTDLGERSGN